MNYINNQSKLENIKLAPNNFYVVADFDKTITAGLSNSTWGSIAETGVLQPGYKDERMELYKKYRPIEIDSNMDDETKSNYMAEWWRSHIQLFFKYGLVEEAIKEAASERILQFRAGSKEFLEYLYKNNIPLLIVSAGIGNVIKEFLINNNCDFDNITIISNFIEFKDGKVKGIIGNTIHSMNKSVAEVPEECKEKISNKEYVILMGDGLGDIKMVPSEILNKAISIGFLEEKIEENLEKFNQTFDIVCTNETSMLDAVKLAGLNLK